MPPKSLLLPPSAFEAETVDQTGASAKSSSTPHDSNRQQGPRSSVQFQPDSCQSKLQTAMQFPHSMQRYPQVRFPAHGRLSSVQLQVFASSGLRLAPGGPLFRTACPCYPSLAWARAKACLGSATANPLQKREHHHGLQPLLESCTNHPSKGISKPSAPTSPQSSQRWRQRGLHSQTHMARKSRRSPPSSSASTGSPAADTPETRMCGCPGLQPMHAASAATAAWEAFCRTGPVTETAPMNPSASSARSGPEKSMAESIAFARPPSGHTILQSRRFWSSRSITSGASYGWRRMVGTATGQKHSRSASASLATVPHMAFANTISGARRRRYADDALHRLLARTRCGQPADENRTTKNMERGGCGTLPHLRSTALPALRSTARHRAGAVRPRFLSFR